MQKPYTYKYTSSILILVYLQHKIYLNILEIYLSILNKMNLKYSPAVKEKHKAKDKDTMKHCKRSFYSSILTLEMFQLFSFLRNILMCWNRDYVQWYDPDMQSSCVIQKHLYIQYTLHRRHLLSITFESRLLFTNWTFSHQHEWESELTGEIISKLC